MKNIIRLLTVILLILALTSCQGDVEYESSDVESDDTTSGTILDPKVDAYFNTFANFEYAFDKVLVQDSNYRIKESDDYAGNFYEIYDNEGNLLDYGYHDWRGSFDITKEDNIVVLEYGLSGTNVFPKYRFYDVKKGKVSRYFDGPVSTQDGLIAYFIIRDDSAVVALQDIFDSSEFYMEFTGSFDENIFGKIGDISLSENEITIEYYDWGKEEYIITETFNLKKNIGK